MPAQKQSQLTRSGSLLIRTRSIGSGREALVRSRVALRFSTQDSVIFQRNLYYVEFALELPEFQIRVRL